MKSKGKQIKLHIHLVYSVSADAIYNTSPINCSLLSLLNDNHSQIIVLWNTSVSKFKVLQNHRILRVGRDLWGPSSSTPLQWAGTPQIRLPRAWSIVTLNVFRDGASTTSLATLFQCLTTLTVKDLFLLSNINVTSLRLKSFSLTVSGQILLKSLSSSFL